MAKVGTFKPDRTISLKAAVRELKIIIIITDLGRLISSFTRARQLILKHQSSPRTPQLRFSKIHFNSILDLQSGLFSSGLPAKITLYPLLLSLLNAIGPTQLRYTS